MKLTKKLIHDFLSQHQLMSLATYGEHPWIASVYYSFDKDLNLYFLSDPATLHCRQIAKNNQVAISIADSRQEVSILKKGLQIYGIAKRISEVKKIKHALSMWKETLKVTNPELTYSNMLKKVIKGRMYQITPKKIKFFNQELFPVEDGQEPILDL